MMHRAESGSNGLVEANQVGRQGQTYNYKSPGLLIHLMFRRHRIDLMMNRAESGSNGLVEAN